MSALAPSPRRLYWLKRPAQSRYACQREPAWRLPEWLLADKTKHPDVVSLRFKNLPLAKIMSLATRPEDAQLEYIQWLIEHAQSGNR
jgi:hypothetical protein